MPDFRGKPFITVCARPDALSARLDHVVFYDKPLLKFERLLETYLSFAPKGFRSFIVAMPVWIKEKLFLKNFFGKNSRPQV